MLVSKFYSHYNYY